MWWFPDRVIVLFSEVKIDLYMVITDGNFFRNIVTSLNASLPSEEAICKINETQVKLQYVFILFENYL